MASADLGEGLILSDFPIPLSSWLQELLPGPKAPALSLCGHVQAALCVSSSVSDEDKCNITSKFSLSLSSN